MLVKHVENVKFLEYMKIYKMAFLKRRNACKILQSILKRILNVEYLVFLTTMLLAMDKRLLEPCHIYGWVYGCWAISQEKEHFRLIQRLILSLAGLVVGIPVYGQRCFNLAYG